MNDTSKQDSLPQAPESTQQPAEKDSPAKGGMGRWLLLLVLIGGLLWVLFPALYTTIAFPLMSGDPAFSEDQQMQLWTHRGLWGDSAALQNSADAVAAGEQAGFAGTEIDVWWIDGTGFLVGHDLENVFGDSAETTQLADVFEKCESSSFQFWLDMKWLNQPKLEVAGFENAAQELTRLIQQHGLQGRVFVEASNPAVLTAFCSRCPDVRGILWISDWDKMPGAIQYRLKKTCLSDGIRIVSRPLDGLQPGDPDPFAHLTRFFYTAETEADVALAKELGADVVLVDGRAAQTSKP